MVVPCYVEDFYIDLLTLWPHLEDFEAFMSPATLEAYSKFYETREKVVLVDER